MSGKKAEKQEYLKKFLESYHQTVGQLYNYFIFI